MAPTLVEGRTRWKRFAVVLALSLLLAGLLMFDLAHGAIGASFAESGSSFKTSASQLRGSGFAQFGSVDRAAGGADRHRFGVDGQLLPVGGRAVASAV